MDTDWSRSKLFGHLMPPDVVALVVFQSCSLLRSKSFCHTDIEKLLDSEDGASELIGDFTKVRTTTGLTVKLSGVALRIQFISHSLCVF